MLRHPGTLVHMIRQALFGCVVAVAASAQPPISGPDTSSKGLEQELTAVAYRRIHAFDEGDTLAWRALVADGYIISSPYGGISTKAQQIASFTPRSPGYENEFRITDVHLIPAGNVVVMNYRILESENWDGQRVTTAPLRKTDVYQRIDGRWLILASHESFEPVTPVAAALKAVERRAYQGRYRLTRAVVYEVTADSAGLLISEEGTGDRMRLIHLSDSTFVFAGSEYRATFTGGRSGRVSAVRLRLAGYDLIAHRLPDRP
jgi:hypothetical protein